MYYMLSSKGPHRLGGVLDRAETTELFKFFLGQASGPPCPYIVI